MTTKADQYGMKRSPWIQSVGSCLLVICVGALLAGCGSQQSVENEDDKARPERLSLQQQLDALQDKLALREGELRATRERLEDPLPPVAGAEPPRLAGVVLGRYSGPIDLDGDAVYDALRVYVRPVDQRGRQMTAEGTARVRLIVTPADGEPQTILDKTYEPRVFRTAYRSGVAGTHYTLKADLPEDLPVNATLHVSLTDAATGRAYTAAKPVALVRGADK